jgi:hypothetical protein
VVKIIPQILRRLEQLVIGPLIKIAILTLHFLWCANNNYLQFLFRQCSNIRSPSLTIEVCFIWDEETDFQIWQPPKVWLLSGPVCQRVFLFGWYPPRNLLYQCHDGPALTGWHNETRCRFVTKIRCKKSTLRKTVFCDYWCFHPPCSPDHVALTCM